MTPERLRILYATVSGTARQVAEAIQLQCSDLTDEPVPVQDMLTAPASVFDPGQTALLLCVATSGSGDLPVNAQALYGALQSNPRYLGGLRYGVIALGDSSYGTTFCGGGLMVDALLQDMGAERVGDILRLDASEETEPEQAAIAWFRDWCESAGLG